MLGKTCNAEYCQYKTLGGTMPGCSYEGYCDYQTPRDSRPIAPWPPIYDNPMPNPLTCPICGLPYTMCTGHTTCGGSGESGGQEK